MAESRHALDGDIITIAPGVAIYKTGASPFWQARIWNATTKKYVVKSTKETSRIAAREAALELLAVKKAEPPKVPEEFTFKAYAIRYVQVAQYKVARNQLNANYLRTLRLCLENEKWGLIKTLGDKDIRHIKTRDFLRYRTDTMSENPHLSSSTLNSVQAAFRNVFKVAREEGVIDDVPQTPRVTQSDNPRSFFRFKPLVPKEHDEYAALRRTALMLAEEGRVVRGVPITRELYDIILFVVHSFVRPTVTELYALRHRDVTIAVEPKRLLLTVANGKTGYRVANTMPAAASVYQRVRARYPNAKRDDFLFLPDYANRATASRIVQRQFIAVLEEAGLKGDAAAGDARSMYSLRHTAICMRLIKSHGRVNIFNLAKTAGTSVDQIERFYAKNLPLSAELAKNLQSMGE